MPPCRLVRREAKFKETAPIKLQTLFKLLHQWRKATGVESLPCHGAVHMPCGQCEGVKVLGRTGDSPVGPAERDAKVRRYPILGSQT